MEQICRDGQRFRVPPYWRKGYENYQANIRRVVNCNTPRVFLVGYLIYKSGYLPKALGVLFIIASRGYLIDNFSYILPENYVTGAACFALPIAIAEIAFPLWLLIKGVNVEKW